MSRAKEILEKFKTIKEASVENIEFEAGNMSANDFKKVFNSLAKKYAKGEEVDTEVDGKDINMETFNGTMVGFFSSTEGEGGIDYKGKDPKGFKKEANSMLSKFK